VFYDSAKKSDDFESAITALLEKAPVCQSPQGQSTQPDVFTLCKQLEEIRVLLLKVATLLGLDEEAVRKLTLLTPNECMKLTGEGKREEAPLTEVKGQERRDEVSA
jgi:hypothetical protein